MYEGESWDYEPQLDTLRSETDRFIAQARRNQISTLIADETKTITEGINQNIMPLLNNATTNMWPNIRDAMASILDHVETYIHGGMH